MHGEIAAETDSAPAATHMPQEDVESPQSQERSEAREHAVEIVDEELDEESSTEMCVHDSFHTHEEVMSYTLNHGFSDTDEEVEKQLAMQRQLELMFRCPPTHLSSVENEEVHYHPDTDATMMHDGTSHDDDEYFNEGVDADDEGMMDYDFVLAVSSCGRACCVLRCQFSGSRFLLFFVLRQLTNYATFFEKLLHSVPRK